MNQKIRRLELDSRLDRMIDDGRVSNTYYGCQSHVYRTLFVAHNLNACNDVD